MLSVEGNDSIGLLTGDHSYRQIYKVISNSKIEKPYVMVVPHHGGNAGKFDEALWSTVSWHQGVYQLSQLVIRIYHKIKYIISL